MKYKAPAVHQAIEILELLMDSGPLTLGQIAEITGFSKATILRLLDTMETHAWVGRNLDCKTYEPLVVIRSKHDPAQRLESLIQRQLDALCSATNHTVEWYHLRKDYAEIVQRCEPIDRAVSIRAKLGFRRNYTTELDAVVCVAMASGDIDCREKEPDNGYVIYKFGQQTHISLDESLELVSHAGDGLMTYDNEWNGNGIRRHAVGVKSPNGSLAGILAVATSFTPQADSEIKKVNNSLQACAKKLAKIGLTIS
jgi:DNA-binding IclR family transcriptional regulator